MTLRNEPKLRKESHVKNIKNKRKLFGTQSGMFCAIALIAVIVFSVVSCGDGSDDGSSDAQQLSATAANFEEVLSGIKSPGNYVINLTGDLLDFKGGVGVYTAGANVTVKGTGSNKITFKKEADFWAACLFIVEGGKLSFENINLSRSAGNFDTWCIALVNGGTLEIKKGAVLSFNDGGNNYYTGIEIYAGNFIMSGGTIEKCQNGVIIAENKSGSITMSGGTIRDVKQHSIALWGPKNSTVTIKGGTIGKGEDWGIYISGANNNKKKSKGSVISGKAVCIDLGKSQLQFSGDAGSGDVFKATTNADGSGIASQEGAWNL
jgi:hypothetical protein